MKRVFVCLLIVALFQAHQAVGQTTPWTVTAKTPSGYTLIGDSDRRLRWRRVPSNETTTSIMISVIPGENGITSPQAYLDDLTRSRETAVADSSKEITVAGRTGKMMDTTAPALGLPERTARRRHRIVSIDATNFALITSEIVSSSAPTAELSATLERDVENLLATLSFGERKTAESAPTAPRRTGVEFSNDLVLPFKFRSPDDWSVSADQGQVPGSLLVFASPDRDIPPESSRHALRVQVLGYVPDLLSAADPLRRAVDMVREQVEVRAGYRRIEVSRTFRAGTVDACLLTYDPPLLDQRTPDGMILVAVVDCALLTAEITWPETLAAASEQAASRLLTSFQMETAAALTAVEFGPGHLIEYPAAFGVAELAVEDEGFGLVFESPDGVEVVVRRLPGIASEPFDPAQFDEFVRTIVDDELRLVPRNEIIDIGVFQPAGVAIGRRLFLYNDESSTDVFVFVRGTSVYVAVVSSPDGIESLGFGQALRLVLSARAVDETPPFSLIETGANGLVTTPVIYGATGVAAYNRSGALTAGHYLRLMLEPDGTARFIQSDGEQFNQQRGQYRLSADRVDITFSDGSRRTLERRNKDESLWAADLKVSLYRLPGLN